MYIYIYIYIYIYAYMYTYIYIYIYICGRLCLYSVYPLCGCALSVLCTLFSGQDQQVPRMGVAQDTAVQQKV